MNGYRSYSSSNSSPGKAVSSDSASERYLPIIINLLLSGAVIFSSLILPFYLNGLLSTYVVSWISFVSATAVIFVSGKKLSHSIIITVLAVLCIGMLASPVIPAFVFGTVVSVGAGSALVCSSRKRFAPLSLILPIIAYAVSIAVTNDPLVSLSALIFVLPITAMGLTSRFNVKKVTSVALCAITEALLICGAVALWVYSLYGSLTFETVNSAADYFTGGIEYYFEHALKTVYQVNVTEYIRKTISSFADLVVNVLPGMIGALCISASYLSHSVHIGLMSAHGIDRCLKERNTKLTVSFEAALIFVAAYIMTYATDSSNMISFAATVSMNICIILMPCLAYMGIDAISALPRKLGFLGLIIWGVIIITVLSAASSSFLFVFALIGSAFVIIRHIDYWAKDFYSKGDMK